MVILVKEIINDIDSMLLAQETIQSSDNLKTMIIKSGENKKDTIKYHFHITNNEMNDVFIVDFRNKNKMR